MLDYNAALKKLQAADAALLEWQLAGKKEPPMLRQERDRLFELVRDLESERCMNCLAELELGKCLWCDVE